ncbi:hypothetical protein ACV22V_08190 [Burkholderia sp. AW33-5]
MKITDDMLTEWRKQFEAEFPMPPDCIWTGKGYSQTRYDAWRAQEYAHMWNGFVAARRTTPDREAWQPIETAPKDGRTLLLGYPNACGKWRTVRGQWMSQNYIDECWEDPDDVEPGWFETPDNAEDPPNCWGIDPTHWMPLPAAPTSDKGGA